MKTHTSILVDRVLRAAMRSQCRYRVVAVGIDSRNRIIGLATNSPRLESRGWHAEERLIHRSPRSLAKIIIARVGATGLFLPIDPCKHCAKIATKRGIRIERIQP